jgi:hypothetical protein
MRLTPRQAARLESLEAELDAAPADHRRVIALKATGVMFAASGVTPLERDAAAARVVAQLPSGWAKQPELAETVADLLAERLATDPRRSALRNAVTVLVAEFRDGLPRLTEELERALADPADTDPAEDVLWVAAVAHSFAGE